MACEPPQKVSEIPELQFRKISYAPGIDNSELGNQGLNMNLELWIRDGNADIYWLPNDTISPGVYVNYFQKMENTYTPLDLTDTVSYFKIEHALGDPRSQRIFEPSKINKTLEGTMTIKVFFFESQVERYDTLKLEIFMRDREGNESEMVSTPDFPFEMVEFSSE
ncbi:MAG: hypothetical protein GVY19_10280 [Bacteroidetes bacterium]|nr:hypothetical protein [Bacteroidota bacterium]